MMVPRLIDTTDNEMNNETERFNRRIARGNTTGFDSLVIWTHRTHSDWVDVEVARGALPVIEVHEVPCDAVATLALYKARA
jgi:hypothetical protein